TLDASGEFVEGNQRLGVRRYGNVASADAEQRVQRCSDQTDGKYLVSDEPTRDVRGRAIGGNRETRRNGRTRNHRRNCVGRSVYDVNGGSGLGVAVITHQETLPIRRECRLVADPAGQAEWRSDCTRLDRDGHDLS